MTTHKKRERNSSDYSQLSQVSKSRQRSSTLLPRSLLPVILLVTLAAFVMSAHRGSAHRQVVPLVTVRTASLLNCNPAPTPTPVSGGGGGCGFAFDEGGSNACECDPGPSPWRKDAKVSLQDLHKYQD